MNVFILLGAGLMGFGLFQEFSKKRVSNAGTPQPKEEVKPIHVADMPGGKSGDKE